MEDGLSASAPRAGPLASQGWGSCRVWGLGFPPHTYPHPTRAQVFCSCPWVAPSALLAQPVTGRPPHSGTFPGGGWALLTEPNTSWGMVRGGAPLGGLCWEAARLKERAEGWESMERKVGRLLSPPHRARQASALCPIQGLPSKPVLFHLCPSQPFTSQQVMLLESERSGVLHVGTRTELEARKHRLLPPCCKGPELQGES